MKQIIKLAFIKSLTVMAGYLVLGIGFGIIAKKKWLWNTLISVVSGTIIYMILIQFVFI